MLGAVAAFLSILIARLERIADKTKALRSADANLDPNDPLAVAFMRRMEILSRAIYLAVLSALASAALNVRFEFDKKGWIGMDDGEASGGQQVMKSLLLLVALMRDEDRPGGFVFIDEPFAHLDIFNIDKVGAFLKSTRAQYILTTPATHNINVFQPSDLTLVTSKRRPGATWAQPLAVLRRRTEAA